MLFKVSEKFICCYIIILCVVHFSEVIAQRRFSESYGRRRLQTDCGINRFKCDMGTCISEEDLCDGKEDCPDGSDETRDCRNIIPCGSKFLFQCDYGACINKTFACDGKKDCKDNSDELEAACKNRCRNVQFECNSGQCIDENLICDGIPDCSDNSDESRQLCLNTACPVYTYQCEYGACVHRAAKCNGIQECADGSDEKNCRGSALPTVPPTSQAVPTTPSQGSDCDSEQFRCASGQCIEKDRMCDGAPDCIDDSDERRSVCSRIVCPPYAFRCTYGGCVNRRAICNGVKDCFDNSDERYCSPVTRPPLIPAVKTTTTEAPQNPSPVDGCVLPRNPRNGVYRIGGAQTAYRPNSLVSPYSVLVTNCNEGYKTSPPEESLSICVNSTWAPAPPACSQTASISKGRTISTVLLFITARLYILH